MLGHVLRCHICSLSSVRFCQSDNISSEPVCELSAGVLLLHDNAPVHMSAKSQAAIQQCGFQQLNHPPNSPDLAPSDYFLFRVMKNFFGVNDFQAMKKSRRRSRPGLKSSQKIFFFQGEKLVATKVGEVYWVIRGLHWKIKKYFFWISCFFLTRVDKLLNAPRIWRVGANVCWIINQQNAGDEMGYSAQGLDSWLFELNMRALRYLETSLTMYPATHR